MLIAILCYNQPMLKKIVFITKSLCHHQVFLSDKLYDIYGDRFTFIQIREPLPFRVAAHQEGFERPYLKTWCRSKEENKECIKLLNSADVIIRGEVSHKISRNFNKNSLLLYYSERIFKPELEKPSFFEKRKRFVRLWVDKLFPVSKKRYLLSAGAYTPLDYAKFGLFRNKSFKWGYFPAFSTCSWESISECKKKNSELNLVWCSRLIQYKHPESAINVAKFLKRKNVKFIMHILGDGEETEGELKSYLKNEIKTNGLEDFVIMHGKVLAEDVLKFYKQCDIALFTSSFAEGWGVGINEAMNFGCAVVASHSTGSATYLIKSGENGIIYEFGNDNSLCNEVYKLALDKEKRLRLGLEAYNTIQNCWNYQIAAERLTILIDNLLQNKGTPFLSGPCSIAEVLKEDYVGE